MDLELPLKIMNRMTRPPLPTWVLRVVEAKDITPHMKRIVFNLSEPDTFAYQPGQDLVLQIAGPSGELLRRHYTIRRFDRETATIAIDFVLHGHNGPAEQWAICAKLGDSLEARGPRGHTMIQSSVDWHLFVGDETCLPGIFAMLEDLPKQARAITFLEVQEKADRQRVDCKCELELEWLIREGPAAPSSAALIERVALFAPPPGRGQAYLIGETSTVRSLRRGLLARGLEKKQITAEGYWRPGREGGHDHIFDLI